MIQFRQLTLRQRLLRWLCPAYGGGYDDDIA